MKRPLKPCECSRGLVCLICHKPLHNKSKTDYCVEHLPRRFKSNELMWD